MGIIHVALLSTHGQKKETAAREAICVDLQVLILFNMADHLMNIHCRKKVMPSTTILCQVQTVQTAQTQRRRPASIWEVKCQLQKFLILLGTMIIMFAKS